MVGEDFPWTLKGVSEEARAAARKAAEEAGRSVGEWLSDVIRAVEAVESRIDTGEAQRADAGPDSPTVVDQEILAAIDRLERRIDEVERNARSAIDEILDRLSERP